MQRRRDSGYERNVFINCPFDDEYSPIFEAIVFTIQACGFRPMCARSRLNSGEVRLQKILEIIGDCRYSIHDLSRTELDRTTALPRFNMPLELGIDLGCRAYSNVNEDKSFLIFDRDRFRFQTYVSASPGRTSRTTQTVRIARLPGFAIGFVVRLDAPGFQEQRRCS